MLNRPERIKSIMLSPGVSIILAILGATFIVFSAPQWFITLPLSLVVGVWMTYEIKSKTLFKGGNFPFLANFLLLQSLTGQSVTGAVFALVSLAGFILAIANYENRSNTRMIFTYFLICAVGLLLNRSFAMLIPVMFFVFVAVRAMTFRGFVAIFLAILTPVILLLPTNILDIDSVFREYTAPWLTIFQTSDVNLQVIVSCVVALMVTLMIFLTAYGYPAKQRAGNMAMIVLTFGAMLLSLVDIFDSSAFLPLLNLCIAYQCAHFAATRTFGWLINLLLALVVCVLFIAA